MDRDEIRLPHQGREVGGPGVVSRHNLIRHIGIADEYLYVKPAELAADLFPYPAVSYEAYGFPAQFGNMESILEFLIKKK